MSHFKKSIKEYIIFSKYARNLHIILYLSYSIIMVYLSLHTEKFLEWRNSYIQLITDNNQK